MKNTFYMKSTLLLFVVVAMFSSCLKDDSRYVNFAGSKPLIEFPAATGVAGTGIFQSVGLDIKSTPVPVNILVNVAAPNPLNTSLTVKVSLDQTALTTYNTANGTNYILLPAADYASTFSVTIPANQNSANLVVNVSSNLIDPSITTYVLPLTITDGGGQQISNYKTVLYNIQAKNPYAANYTVTGYKFHPSAPHTLTGTYAITTVGPTTSNCPVGDLGGSNYSFNFDVSGSSLTKYVAVGATPAAPASGFMTTDIPTPGGAAFTVAKTQDGATPGVAPYNQANYGNTYDATNKTFYFHIGYGAGSTSQEGYTRQFYMKLVRQ